MNPARQVELVTGRKRFFQGFNDLEALAYLADEAYNVAGAVFLDVDMDILILAWKASEILGELPDV